MTVQVRTHAHRPWRHAKVTRRRTNIDFAECMRDLVDNHYPHAPVIRVVLDNLSTHQAGSLYEAFPPAEARRILRRIEFHIDRARAKLGEVYPNHEVERARKAA